MSDAQPTDRYALVQTRSQEQASGNSVDNTAETVFTIPMTTHQQQTTYPEDEVFVLAAAVLRQLRPEWKDEASGEAHGYHDEKVPGCVHCELHWRFQGKGYRHAVISLATSLAGAECTGTAYSVNPDAPGEGADIHHDGACAVHRVPPPVFDGNGKVLHLGDAVTDWSGNRGTVTDIRTDGYHAGKVQVTWTTTGHKSIIGPQEVTL